MKAVVLAGGFARRLWPLTRDRPKPLLSVGGRPIIEHILDRLGAVEEIDRIFITINAKFEEAFREWAARASFGKEIEIVVEPALREEEKLGAMGALASLLKSRSVADDVIVVAGDNIFDFDIREFLAGREMGCPVVALYDMKDREKIRGKYGVAVLNEAGELKELQEKPRDPATTLVSTGCYFFPYSAHSLISRYLSEGNSPDAPGYFISWLARQTKVHGFVFDGGTSRWFDIGSPESYEEADRAYSEKA